MEDILESYLTGLKSLTRYEKARENVWRVTLPFVAGGSAELVEVYVMKQDDGRYKLTDDGNTVNSLGLSEADIAQKRSALIYHISSISGACLSRENNEIFVLSSKENFTRKLNLLVQCIITTSQLFDTDKNLRDLKSVYTCDLVNELEQREGVERNQ